MVFYDPRRIKTKTIRLMHTRHMMQSTMDAHIGGPGFPGGDVANAIIATED